MKRLLPAAAAASLLVAGLFALPSEAAVGTCDPASRGEAFNQVAMEFPSPDNTGSVLVDALWSWDGTSVMPNCNGPIQSIHTRNLSDVTAWASLPHKRKAPLYVVINAGADSTLSGPGALKQAGLETYTDLLDSQIVYSQP